MFRQAGEVVLTRWLHAGRPSFLVPNIVVVDSTDLVALYTPERTVVKTAADPAAWKKGGTDRWDLVERPWHTTHSLMLVQPERWYAVSAMWWATTHEFAYWYVNFQLPMQRTEHGFETGDLELDIVVRPDGQWHWKDVENSREPLLTA